MTTVSAKDNSFRLRLWSALILGPLVLLILCMGGDIFTLMLAAAGAIGVQEWSRMVLTGKKYHKLLLPLAAGLTALAIAISGLGVANFGAAFSPFITLLILGAFGSVVLAFNFSQRGPNIFQLVFGLIYIGFSLEIMVWLRNGSDYGLYYTLTLLLIVWASDVFAYFTGKAIGGPKLAPKISPKKTWAGLIGGGIGAGIVAAGLASTWVLARYNVLPIGDMTPVGYFVMGFILAVFGQAGDLFMSLFKRHYGIKDTGSIIPGHGGILDRIDALLLVALIFGALVMLLK